MERLGETAKPPPRAAQKRWWMIAVTATIVLALYAGALTWATQRLESDIQKSMHVLSGPIPDHP